MTVKCSPRADTFLCVQLEKYLQYENVNIDVTVVWSVKYITIHSNVCLLRVPTNRSTVYLDMVAKSYARLVKHILNGVNQYGLSVI